MTAPASILELVNRFTEHSADYRDGKYNETQLRREFLDPFFTALGWDMDNASGVGQATREVLHEYSMKIEGQSKAPDYCFRSGTTEKFFVEAKKPSVNLKDDWKPAFQTRAYGWHKNLPFSVLTDFEEFAVYDCRFKPEANDSAQTARTFYCKYSDYEAQWEHIESLFGREAVLSGSLEKQAAAKSKKGVLPFDVDFLHLISGWRERLAQNIAERNRALNLTQPDLNYAVQMTIDRILFLRMCEDRDLEPAGQLQKLRDGKDIYRELLELFRKADNRYNSGLFHFGQEKGRGGFADLLTPRLQIADGVFSDIIYKLYAPSPYNFRIMSVEILGQVYEQFLGKVIRLDGAKAAVEEKPEVRKAGGVYYTPAYIVNYIVAQTVGKLCEGKTPKDVEALRVLDPACGSGSFLIGAYNYLLDWHLDFYTRDEPEKWAARRNPVVFQTKSAHLPDAPAAWRLTAHEKKRILLNNIYGVDIDRQAVEVTKLSLLLKMLEDESPESLPSPQKKLLPSQERLLPDLDANIKCGNSLIGHDFYDGKADADLSAAERERINAFDWDDEFPAIMKGKNKGFDAVIGNPPYIRIQALKEWAPLEVEHLKTQYKSASVGNYDIYVVFVERALQLLNTSGRLGYILPHKFFNAQYGAPLRALMAEGAHLSDVVHFGHQQIFASATTYTCLLFANSQPSDAANIAKVDDLAAWLSSGAATTGKVLSSAITGAEWNFAIGQSSALFEKLSQMPVKLGDVAERIFQGIIPGADKVYAVDLLNITAEVALCYSKALDAEVHLETGILRKIVSGAEAKRFRLTETPSRVIYPYKVVDGVATLIELEPLKQKFPLTFDYFERTRDLLDIRDRGSAKGPQWYQYIRRQNIALQPNQKLAIPRLVRRLRAAYDAEGNFCLDNVDVGGVILHDHSSSAYHFILGLLNSKVLNFYFLSNAAPFRGGYFSANRQYIEQLPIRVIDFSNAADKARHDNMVKLVERMLDLHKQLASARTGGDQTSLQRQIAAADRQIDRLVYELYELSDEEISIVEGTAGQP